VDTFAKDLFYNNKLINQWIKDIYNAPVPIASLITNGIKPSAVCAADPKTSSFIPPSIEGGPLVPVTTGVEASARRNLASATDEDKTACHSMMRGGRCGGGPN